MTAPALPFLAKMTREEDFDPIGLGEDTNWDSFRILLVLSKEGSVAKAALALGLEQPIIVKRLASLETLVGVKLFSKTDGSELSFTDAGKIVLAEAERLALSVSSLAFAARRKQRQYTLVIGSTEGFGAHWIVPRLPLFYADNPNSAVRVSVGDDTSDVDFFLQPGGPKDGFVNTIVGMLPFKFYASPAYLEKRGTPLSWSDLIANHDLIMADYYFDEGPWIEWSKVIKDRAASQFLHTNSSAAVVSAVRNGLGIALLSGYAQNVYADIIPLPDMEGWARFELPLTLSHEPGRNIMPHVADAIRFFRQEIKKGI